MTLLSALGCLHAEGRVDYLVEGRVVQVPSGDPVAGAQVHWSWPTALSAGAPSESAALSTAVTDAAGRYRLSCPLSVPAVYGLGLERPISMHPQAPDGATLSVSGPGLLPASVQLDRANAFENATPDGTTLVRVRAPDVAVRLAR